jgi:hypothetical protein
MLNNSFWKDKRALLVDIDHANSTDEDIFPNLALMKISALIKNNGGSAAFNENDPTHVFISVIFKRNREKALSSANMFRILDNEKRKLQHQTGEKVDPPLIIDVGGTGYTLHKRLCETELLTPDYSLYPNIGVNLLRELGASSFVMINEDNERTQRMTDLKRYCLPQIYWSKEFSEYKRSVVNC